MTNAIDALTPDMLFMLAVMFTLMGAGLGLVLGHIVATVTLVLAPNRRRERPSSIPRRRW